MNHLIYDIKLAKPIDDRLVEILFSEIVSLLKLKVLKKEKYIFGNGGFTIFYLLAESHISAHYRIEDNYLALDVYSCNKVDEKAIEILLKLKLPVKTIASKGVSRGIGKR